MSDRTNLNFPAVKMRVKRIGDAMYVWDSLRGKYLLLTPEERVRRYAIGFLVSHCNIPATSLVQEYPVPLNGMSQRADIVAVDASARPLMLVECKAPDVELRNIDRDKYFRIDADVFAQAVRYNSVVGARYVVLTNGITHFCYECENGEYRALGEFPRF